MTSASAPRSTRRPRRSSRRTPIPACSRTRPRRTSARTGSSTARANTLYLCASARDQRRLRPVFVTLLQEILEAAYARSAADRRAARSSACSSSSTRRRTSLRSRTSTSSPPRARATASSSSRSSRTSPRHTTAGVASAPTRSSTTTARSCSAPGCPTPEPSSLPRGCWASEEIAAAVRHVRRRSPLDHLVEDVAAVRTARTRYARRRRFGAPHLWNASARAASARSLVREPTPPAARPRSEPERRIHRLASRRSSSSLRPMSDAAVCARLLLSPRSNAPAADSRPTARGATSARAASSGASM